MRRCKDCEWIDRGERNGWPKQSRPRCNAPIPEWCEDQVGIGWTNGETDATKCEAFTPQEQEQEPDG